MSGSTPSKFAYKRINGYVHVLVINLRDKTLKFITNVDAYEPTPVSKLAVRYSAEYGINADQFSYDTNGNVRPFGLYAYSGDVHKGENEPTVYISKKNVISLVRPKNIYTAVSGNHVLIRDGKIVQVDEGFVLPRTAIGWNQRFMIWVVVDGVESEKSGMSLSALSILMKSLGCQNAVNMDGGGSSTMVHVEDNTVSVLNIPSDDNVPGRERPVSNFLGVR